METDADFFSPPRYIGINFGHKDTKTLIHKEAAEETEGISTEQ